MANLVIKRVDANGGVNTLYMAEDGSWVASTDDAFVTTDADVAATISAALNTTMLTTAAFFQSPPRSPYLASVLTL